MKIGVVKEVKNNENRVSLTPAGVLSLINHHHDVVVEKNAGAGSGFTDEEYREMGATISDDVAEVWKCDMVMKVKEPLPQEYQYFREGLILFTYLHLAPAKALTKALLDKKVTAIAYESVQLDDLSLPLLMPMSEVAGRMSIQIGAQFLEKIRGGKGVLLGGVPGVPKGNVTIIGGGVAGLNAAKIALGLGANVTILDINPKRLAQLEDIFAGQIQTLISNDYNIQESVKQADIVVGAVLISGHKAPCLVTESTVKQMKPGSVIVDVAIDQGGIFETTDTVTTHDNPTYVKHDVVHYAVANMPGAVPRTSTFALTNYTLPYALQIANKGVVQSAKSNIALARGINTINGLLTIKEVAEDQNLRYTAISSVLN